MLPPPRAPRARAGAGSAEGGWGGIAAGAWSPRWSWWSWGGSPWGWATWAWGRRREARDLETDLARGSTAWSPVLPIDLYRFLYVFLYGFLYRLTLDLYSFLSSYSGPTKRQRDSNRHSTTRRVESVSRSCALV